MGLQRAEGSDGCEDLWPLLQVPSHCSLCAVHEMPSLTEHVGAAGGPQPNVIETWLSPSKTDTNWIEKSTHMCVYMHTTYHPYTTYTTNTHTLHTSHITNTHITHTHHTPIPLPHTHSLPQPSHHKTTATPRQKYYYRSL